MPPSKTTTRSRVAAMKSRSASGKRLPSKLEFAADGAVGYAASTPQRLARLVSLPPLQEGSTTGLRVLRFPFCATTLTVARLVAAQRFCELTRSPFLPPCMESTRREKGASGVEEKVVRMPPF